MLVTTEIILAMHCPVCGKIDDHSISRFAFSGGRSSEFNCSCGAVKLEMAMLKDGRYALSVPCVVCGRRHLFIVPGRRLWSGDMIELFCRQTGIELGWLGSDGEVRRLAPGRENGLDALFGEFAAGDYFHNSRVMYAVLRWLRALGEQGKVFCRCGNGRIEVDIFPDRLELHCPACDRMYIIYAETEADLQTVENLRSLRLDDGLRPDGPGRTGKIHSFTRRHRRF